MSSFLKNVSWLIMATHLTNRKSKVDKKHTASLSWYQYQNTDD